MPRLGKNMCIALQNMSLSQKKTKTVNYVKT